MPKWFRLKAVIDSSYGSRLAWQWAIQHPSMVQGVIPIITCPFPVAGRRDMQDFLAIEP
jgi:homoserine acetyltransferase